MSFSSDVTAIAQDLLRGMNYAPALSAKNPLKANMCKVPDNALIFFYGANLQSRLTFLSSQG